MKRGAIRNFSQGKGTSSLSVGNSGGKNGAAAARPLIFLALFLVSPFFLLVRYSHLRPAPLLVLENTKPPLQNLRSSCPTEHKDQQGGLIIEEVTGQRIKEDVPIGERGDPSNCGIYLISEDCETTLYLIKLDWSTDRSKVYIVLNCFLLQRQLQLSYSRDVSAPPKKVPWNAVLANLFVIFHRLRRALDVDVPRKVAGHDQILCTSFADSFPRK